MKSFLKKFIRDERGLAAVEYAIIAGVIVAGLIGLFGQVGDWSVDRMTDVVTELNAN